MERRGDALAGHKHHVTKDFLEFLKQQTMSMCQQENLNQVDLLSPAKVRITDREYWAQRRGQRDPDAHNKAEGKPLSRFETQNMSSPDLAFAIKKENLKQEAKSVAYLLECGLTPKEMENRYAFASEDFHSQAGMFASGSALPILMSASGPDTITSPTFSLLGAMMYLFSPSA